jgi:hypothetical protein
MPVSFWFLMRTILLVILWMVLVPEVAFNNAASALDGAIRIDGTELSVSLDDGQVLRRDDLIGLRLILTLNEQDLEVHINGVEEDRSSDGEILMLYGIAVRDPETGVPSVVCQPDSKGRRAAILYSDKPGQFNLKRISDQCRA